MDKKYQPMSLDMIKRQVAYYTMFNLALTWYENESVQDIYYGYDDIEKAAFVKAKIAEGKDCEKYTMTTVFIPEKEKRVSMFDCGCSHHGSGLCLHAATLLIYLSYNEQTVDQINTILENKGEDVSDFFVNSLLANAFEDIKKTVNHKKVHLTAHITTIGNEMLLRFYIGDEKKYSINSIVDFYNNLSAGNEVNYGQYLTFNHSIENFFPDSLGLLNLFLMMIEARKPKNKGYEYTPLTNSSLGVVKSKSICLSNGDIDNLFDLYVNNKVEINGVMVKFISANPKITLNIEKNDKKSYFVEQKQKKEMFFKGINRLYVLKDNVFYQCTSEYNNRIGKLIGMLNKRGKIRIGESDLAKFLSVICKDDVIFIGDVDTKQIIDEMVARLYLDVENNVKVIAKLIYFYNGVSINSLIDEQITGINRDLYKEMASKVLLQQYFNEVEVDSYKVMLNEDELTKFIVSVLPVLNENYELYMSESFKNLSIKRTSVPRVGVNVNGGLLDLSFDFGDLPIEELNQLLSAYRKNKKYYRFSDGSYTDLKNFEQTVEFIDFLHISNKDLKKQEVKIPKHHAFVIEKLLDKKETVDSYLDIDVHSEFRNLLKQIKEIDKNKIEIPTSLKSILRNYQVYGYQWLVHAKHFGFGVILADDMGLGKTLQIITLLLAQKDNKKRSLVVCPSSLVMNWEAEINRYASELKVISIVGSTEQRKELLNNSDDYDVIVTSYDLLKRDIENYEKIEFENHIIDEAQYIKNHATQNAKAVKLINSKQRFALTGTPIENNLAELWSVFDFLMPKYLGSYTNFKNNFEIPIVKAEDKDKLNDLKDLVAPFILRRLKKDVLADLPDKTEMVMYAKMEAEQEKLYLANVMQVKDVLNMVSGENMGKQKIQVLAMLTRLRQLCCDPSLYYENFKGDSAKKQMCMELIESTIESNHRILLFSQFTSMLDIIGNELKKRGIEYYRLDGSTNAQKRVEMVDEFNNNQVPIFLISLKAGGTGLNLTGADVVIHYDPWWNISAQNQATDRAHRIGQKNNVTVYKLIAKNTIEEKILQLQEQKRELVEAVISENEKNIMQMTKQELMGLFD